MPGLVAGVAAFTGDSTQGNADYKANTSLPDFSSVHGRITLADVHVRWQPSAWDLQVLLAKGGFSDAESINQVLLAYNTTTAGSRPYVASEFYGWLVQAAYKFSLNGESSVSPFARFEEYDTQAAMPSGFTASPANADHVLTVGASYKPVAQVVFKTDFQNFNEDSTQNRFNLGLGYMF